MAVTINAKQAQAIARIISDQGSDDDIAQLENEYAVGAGKMVEVSVLTDNADPVNKTWLVGRDGGVIEL